MLQNTRSDNTHELSSKCAHPYNIFLFDLGSFKPCNATGRKINGSSTLASKSKSTKKSRRLFVTGVDGDKKSTATLL